jgi:hypothetical protein
MNAAVRVLGALSCLAAMAASDVRAADSGSAGQAGEGETVGLPPGKSAGVDLSTDYLKIRVLDDRASMELFAADGRLNMAYCFLPPAQGRSLAISSEGERVLDPLVGRLGAEFNLVRIRNP